MFLGKQRHFLVRFWIAAFCALAVGVALYWLHENLRGPTQAERSDEALAKIQELFREGTEDFENKDVSSAASKFEKAVEIAGRKRAEEEKRLEKEAAERKPIKFEKPSAVPVVQREFTFSLREAEARRYLAAARIVMLQLKIAAKRAEAPKNADAIVADPEEAQFIRNQIDSGLVANPRDRYLHPEFYHLLGQLEVLTGNYAKAVSALEKAVELKPDFAEAYNDLGIAYSNPFFLKAANGGAYQQKAVAAFEKALLVSSDKPLANAHYNLGMFYAQAEQEQKLPPKQRADAIRHLKAFLDESKSTDDQDYQHARKLLDKLQAQTGKPKEQPAE